MSDFDKASAFTLSDLIEGGYVSPEQAARIGDSGGETNHGITTRDFPDVDIKSLTKDEARAIYERDYWSSDGIQKSACDRLPWPLNLVHFDATVNIGNAYRPGGGAWLWTGNANKILQNALCVEADGHIGPKTLAAVVSPDVDPTALALMQVSERERWYKALVASNPARANLLSGWLTRCQHVRNKIQNS